VVHVGFPVPLADYVRPLTSMAFFADGFCEQELGLHPLGLERLLGDWQRWVYFFFGLVTLEIWGRLHFRRESLKAIGERIRKLERVSGTQSP
jgi:hypothetical protein